MSDNKSELERVRERSEYEGLREIELGLLDAGTYSVRSKNNSQKFQNLVRSIGKLGVMVPLAVARQTGDKKGRYVVIYGNRRKAGAEEAGLKSIECYVFSADLPEDARELMSLHENYHVGDLDATEMARLIARILNRFNGDKKAVSAYLSCSVKEINEWLDSLALIEKGAEVTAKNVPVASLIKKIFDESKWLDVFNKVKHFEEEEAKQAVRELASGRSEEVFHDAFFSKKSRPRTKTGGTTIQVKIEDNDLAAAIDEARAHDRLANKAEFTLATLIKEVKSRGLYKEKVTAV